MGFEPTAFCLGSKRSTTELYPQKMTCLVQGSESTIMHFVRGLV